MSLKHTQLLTSNSKAVLTKIKNHVALPPFASLPIDRELMSRPSLDYGSAMQVLGAIADGVAYKSELVGCLLMNSVAVAEHMRRGGTAFFNALTMFNGNLRQIKFLDESTQSPIPYDRFKPLIDELYDQKVRENWVMGGLKMLGIIHPLDVILKSGFDSDHLHEFSIYFNPGEHDTFSTEESYYSHLTNARFSIDMPKGDCTLSEEDLQKIVARTLIYFLVKDFASDEVKKDLTTFSYDELGRLPADGFFLDLGCDLKRVRFYSALLSDKSKILDGYHELLNWLNLFIVAYQDLYGSDKSAEFKRKPVRISFVDKYWQEMTRSKGNIQTLLEPASHILYRPHSSSISVVEGFGGIGVSVKPYKYFASGHSINITFDRETLKRMRIDDFLSLIWRISVLSKNRKNKQGSAVEVNELPVSERSDFKLVSGREDYYKYEKISLNELRASKDLTSFEREGNRNLQLVFQHYRYFISQGTSENSIQLLGDMEKGSQHNFAMALKVIGANLSAKSGETSRMVLMNIMKGRTWFLGESAEGDEKPIVDITPFSDSAIIFVRGKSNKISQLDWLFILCAMVANSGNTIRIAIGNGREMIMGRGKKMAKGLYDELASNRLNPAGFVDENARPPQYIDFELPGDISVTQNPHYSPAAAEEKQAYLNALLWFSQSDVPLKWQPVANESLKSVKRKFRDMSKAYHSDRCTDKKLVSLLSDSNRHWQAVLEMHKPRGNNLEND
ncbi:MAG: hypothetical protein ABIE74_02665 [Pseudomonadota bacterium]